ncbi:MAG TPA: bifunctional methionine sulfoxide reductase B/A protein [Planctomycetota bacterium]|nr:bifunctional methionine sulfoxide reductase B/A protein [Planctomycetota bacterium]
MDLPLNPLTPEEKRVIVNKGTEPPFSGALYPNKAAGIYTCRQCGAGLYRSEDKFDSGCGWPSFDAEITGAVTRTTDADGRRTEITCSRCGGHLGHVFLGERQTPKNTRHCVNSISMAFVPQAQIQRGIFAGGCFWGVEYYFQQVKGVLAVQSGYIGGLTERPTYKQVCSGDSGHIEAVEVLFDPQTVTYEALAKLFFEIHDPTQIDRQGPDHGEQYRSAVFYADDAQKKTAQDLIEQLKKKGLKVATQLVKAPTFWAAEAYHQNYYRDHGGEPYCHRRVKRF